MGVCCFDKEKHRNNKITNINNDKDSNQIKNNKIDGEKSNNIKKNDEIIKNNNNEQKTTKNELISKNQTEGKEQVKTKQFQDKHELSEILDVGNSTPNITIAKKKPDNNDLYTNKIDKEVVAPFKKEVPIQKDNERENNNNNCNNIINNNSKSDNLNKKNEVDIQDIKKVSILKLKKDNSKSLTIKKEKKDTISNSKYSISLNMTIKKVSSISNFIIYCYKYDNNSRKRTLIDQSETREIKPNQVKTFIKTFIVNYNFTQMQPLEFIIKRNNKSEETLNIFLGEIIGNPRLISIHNFSNFIFQIEAKMNNEIKKEIIFLIALSGNLKGLKLFYTITNIGNRYDTNEKNELIYKSDNMQNDSEIIFKQIELPLEKLSEDNNLEDDLVQIGFYKTNDENIEEELGKEKLSINQLLTQKEIELNLDNNIKSKILSQRKNFFNLLQFIYNDFILVTTFCIDFSINNIVHNNNDNFKKLLTAFMDILVHYNKVKFFDCYAYGFTLLKTGESYINEIFPLNRKIPSIEITDVIIKYEKFLKKIEKSKTKTDLTLIIRNLNNIIKDSYELQDKEYNLFIIFTCNDINNEEEFIEELQITCSLNISIVIIGIGKSSFNTIQNIINYVKENVLKRNCVKFLKINDAINEIVENSLIDIPDAMIDFFCENNNIPKIF